MSQPLQAPARQAHARAYLIMKFTALSLCIVLSLSALSNAAEVPNTLAQKTSMNLSKASGKENTPEKGSSTGTKASGDSSVDISSCIASKTTVAKVPEQRKRVAVKSKEKEGAPDKAAVQTGASPKKRKLSGQENNSNKLNTSQSSKNQAKHLKKTGKSRSLAKSTEAGAALSQEDDDSGMHGSEEYSLTEAANLLLNHALSKTSNFTENNDTGNTMEVEQGIAELLFSMAANLGMAAGQNGVGNTRNTITGMPSSTSASHKPRQTSGESDKHQSKGIGQQSSDTEVGQVKITQSQKNAIVRSLFSKLPNKNSNITISVEPFKPQFKGQDGRDKEGLNSMSFGELRSRESTTFFKSINSANRSSQTPAYGAAAVTTTTTTTSKASVPTIIVTPPPVVPSSATSASNSSAAAPNATPASATGRLVPRATFSTGVSMRRPTAGRGTGPTVGLRNALLSGRISISTKSIAEELEITGPGRAPTTEQRAGAPRNAVMTRIVSGDGGPVLQTTDGRGSPCAPTGLITLQERASTSTQPPSPSAPPSTPAVNEISQSYTF